MNFSSVPALTKLFAELAIWYVSLFTYLLGVFVRDVELSLLRVVVWFRLCMCGRVYLCAFYFQCAYSDFVCVCIHGYSMYIISINEQQIHSVVYLVLRAFAWALVFVRAYT